MLHSWPPVIDVEKGLIVTLPTDGIAKRVGWHVPELAKGVISRFPRPSQAQGRATPSLALSSWQGYDQGSSRRCRPCRPDLDGRLARASENRRWAWGKSRLR